MYEPYGFSFIVPCYNEEKRIVACLDSIMCEMRQYYINFEIIVIDNNSTDKTVEKVLEYKNHLPVTQYTPEIVVCKEERKGVVWARTTGSRIARFKFLANIDADNKLPKGWAEIARQAFLWDPDVVAVSGPLIFEGVGRYVTVCNKIFYFFAKLFHMKWPTLQGGNYVILNDTYKKMGGYDLSYEFFGEDTRTAVMASKYGKIRLISAMWVHSSPRRLEGQGNIRTAWTYVINYLSVNILGKNVTNEYRDFR